MAIVKHEIALNTIFGNKFHISAPIPTKEGPFVVPSDSIMILFDDKGIIVEREEVLKLKQFLDEIVD